MFGVRVKESQRRQEHQDRETEDLKKCFKELVHNQSENTQAVAKLIGETRQLVQLQQDFQAAARIGVGAQKLAVWLAKMGAVGVLLASGINWGYAKLIAPHLR